MNEKILLGSSKRYDTNNNNIFFPGKCLFVYNQLFNKKQHTHTHTHTFIQALLSLYNKSLIIFVHFKAVIIHLFICLTSNPIQTDICVWVKKKTFFIHITFWTAASKHAVLYRLVCCFYDFLPLERIPRLLYYYAPIIMWVCVRLLAPMIQSKTELSSEKPLHIFCVVGA